MRVPLLLLAILLPMLASAAPGAAPVPDPWCGVSGGDLPDLWEDTWLEFEALTEFPNADAWRHAPGRVNALLTQFTLLQRGSVRQGQEVMHHLGRTLQALTKLRTPLVDAALATNVPVYTQKLAEVRGLLESARAKYPARALDPALSSFNPAVLLPGSPTLTVKAIAPPLAAGQAAEIQLRLQDATGAGVGSLQLIETHGRRLHALVIDMGLEDYHHEHPITSGAPGAFTFNFTPRKDGDYLLWLDVTPQATGRGETPEAVIRGRVRPSVTLPSVTRMESIGDGLRYRLRLDRSPVRAGQVVKAVLRVTDGSGRPCLGLEPFMGAFAHVVGILDDRHTLLHVHSHGDPPHELMRSGPEVRFRFVVPRRGQLRLFVQTQVNGTIDLARFSFPVE